MSAQRYFRVPAERAMEPGMHVGGAWIGFVRLAQGDTAVAAVPAAGDYSWAMPAWPECQADGSDLPGVALGPNEADEGNRAAAGTPDQSGGENGAPGEAGGASETDPK